MSQTVSTEIAGRLGDLQLNQIPEGVREKCTQAVIDTVGLTIAALETDYGQSILSAFDDKGDATVFGLERGFSADAAAVVNGTCGHGEDFDNTFEGCPVHSGVVMVPAMLAAMEKYRLDPRDVAAGLVAGTEVMCRLGVVANKHVHAAGFHPTGVIGAMSAALGVSVARRLNRQQIVNAMGVAGSLASGIIEYLADGSSTKRLHPGWAAHCGLRASAMGGAGFSGPVSVYEGEHGFFFAFARKTGIDFTPLLEGLGSEWVTTNLAFKPFACGTMTQPYVDCAIELSNRGIDLDNIQSIECEVGEGTVHRLWDPPHIKQNPPTAYAAKFSGPYCVAAGLLYKDAGLSEFTDSSVQNPKALALAQKVTHIIDPNNPYPANYTGHVRLTMKNGEVHEAKSPCLRGGAQAPMSTSEIVAKCEANLHFAGRHKAGAQVLAQFARDLMSGANTARVEVLRTLGR
jgi:2-methylcitrate dehydratase PrpD